MVPFSSATEAFTAYLYNHIQIENTFPDLKSRTLCVDVSAKFKDMPGYGIILLVNEKGEKMKHPIFSPLSSLLPYVFLFPDFAVLTTLLF